MYPAKMLEVRDVATFIPVLAVPMWSSNEAEQYLLRRAGYWNPDHANPATTGGEAFPFLSILLVHLNSGRSEHDCHGWGDRTMLNAHKYIQENWSSLEPGAVVDVQVILGETATPKKSERFSE